MPSATTERPYDACMPQQVGDARLLDLADLAARKGWTYNYARKLLWIARRNRRENTEKPWDLPEPDGPKGRTPYWYETTIDHWETHGESQRPGRGAGGGRPWHQ